MRSILIIAATILVLNTIAYSQLSNETIQTRIRSAGAENNIALTFDAEAKTSKLMAVSENFSRDEAKRSGILAMNFAVGCIYTGDAITEKPDSFLLTFWVLTKKSRFDENHAMTVVLPEEMLVIGSARYVAKPQQQMEYLNFEVSREKLSRIALQSEVRIMLGSQEFTFTKAQMKMLADLLTITEL